MTMDGAECMSSGVHILGFFVGDMGYNPHKGTTNAKRKDYVDYNQDAKTLLPCFMKAKYKAVCLRAGWCVHTGPPSRCVSAALYTSSVRCQTSTTISITNSPVSTPPHPLNTPSSAALLLGLLHATTPLIATMLIG